MLFRSVRAVNVHKRFGHLEVLRGITLDVAGGEPTLVSVAKRQVAQSPTDQFPARILGVSPRGKPEGNAVENPPYAFPHYRLEAVVPDVAVPVGFWRSVGHSANVFYLESFLDELAKAAGKEPMAFRQSMLRAGSRDLAALQTLATVSSWATKVSGVGKGVAMSRSFGGTIAAAVAEIGRAHV